MKARVSYDGILHVESETDYEYEQLEKLMLSGFKHGYYHVGSSQSADKMTLDIAVDE
jgi:hypothetical protein